MAMLEDLIHAANRGELPGLLRAVADALDGVEHDHQEHDEQPRTVSVGRLLVDLDTHRLTGPDGTTAPTRQHFLIVATLAQSAGRIVTFRQMWEAVWVPRIGGDYVERRDLPPMRVEVCRARHVIPAGSGVRVEAVRGVGWLLEAVGA